MVRAVSRSMSISHPYVHGYTADETRRLTDQADALAELLHAGCHHPPGTRILEVGCGVGAQTVHLARNNPRSSITAVDLSAESLAAARDRLAASGADNVDFVQADLAALPLQPASFDHLFICFVLEHLPDPEAALRGLAAMLDVGGSVTVIEGDHGSFLCHPESAAADAAVANLVELQRRAGGDPHIGRRLYPLLCAAGYDAVQVEPVPVYADRSRPRMVDGFTRNTFNAMVAGVEERAARAGLTTDDAWRDGMRGLERAAAEGTAFYCFFRARAVRGAGGRR
jgi:SAM-dependent methyltransferase